MGLKERSSRCQQPASDTNSRSDRLMPSHVWSMSGFHHDPRAGYSKSDGENGPPGGPEKAMLVDGVTINIGGDCPLGFCAAAISVERQHRRYAQQNDRG